MNRMSMVKSLMQVLLLSFVFGSTLTSAQSVYPTKPVRLVVPFGPNGSADLVARVLGAAMSQQMGQPIIIDNKPGANSNVGATFVAKAAADGYTALYNTSSVIFNMSIYPDLPYNTLRDFSPVALTATVPQILVVTPSLPVKNLQQFIAHVRANPGKLNYGAVGVGNIAHLTTLLFLNTNGLKAELVPYNASGAVYQDVLGGRTHFYFATVASAVPFMKDNKVRPIAVTSLTRTKATPDVPTFNESGMPKFEATAWQGIVLPVNTPAAAIRRLNVEALKALKDPEVLSKFDAQGTLALGSTPEEYRAYLKSEHERWSKIIKDANIKYK